MHWLNFAETGLDRALGTGEGGDCRVGDGHDSS